jgi:hypothetical protein
VPQLRPESDIWQKNRGERMERERKARGRIGELVAWLTAGTGYINGGVEDTASGMPSHRRT